MNILLENARKLINDDFDSFVNKREFEEAIGSLSDEIVLTVEMQNNIINEIENNFNCNNIPLAFVLFFTLFTKMRRTKTGNLLEFTNKYIGRFKYEICRFISILCSYNIDKTEENLIIILMQMKKLIESKGSNYDFTTHLGINNLYVEVTCNYFETQIDNDVELNKDEYLDEANNKIDFIINSYNGSVYSKYYLNKGRILVLLGQYGDGENYIIKAIQSIKVSNDRDRLVREYEQYLIKASIIRTRDITNKKLNELDKAKFDSIKTITLMTTLLGFLLGTISIFSEIKDTFTLAMLMLSYLGLLLVILGVVLLGIKFIYKENNKKSLIYDLCLAAVGIIIFSSAMLIILL